MPPIRRLIAGPWCGEFGWELMSWQALIRKASYDYDEVVVCAPAGHEALYTDFNPTYLAHQVAGVRDCWWVSGHDKAQLNAAHDVLRTYTGDWLKPTGLIPIAKQHFVKYGLADRCAEADRFTVLVHARGQIGKRPWHAWPETNWDQLVEALRLRNITVAAIGTESYCPEGAMDRRRIALSRLMDMMSYTGLVAGPSSGPMHLASLCGTPHVVWTDDQVYSAIRGTNKDRYETVWNPLHTPCRILTGSWLAPVDAVLNAILEGLNTWRRPK